MEKFFNELPSCSICLIDRIEGDLVTIGCANNHYFCLSCLLSMANRTEPDKLNCPNCRGGTIAIAWSSDLNKLRNTTLGIKNHIGADLSKVSEMQDIKWWCQIDSLCKIGFKKFPHLFYPNGLNSNTLHKDQLVVLSKNFIQLIRLQRNPTRDRRKIKWFDAEGKNYIEPPRLPPRVNLRSNESIFAEAGRLLIEQEIRPTDALEIFIKELAQAALAKYFAIE